VTSALIIDIQSELKSDHEGVDNTLRETLLNVATGTLPANSAASSPPLSGLDAIAAQAWWSVKGT
jgi:hypothetical protein